ncbi:MAG: DUF2752 domain-containing protein, partial [Planctomycetes bacterium]|nr:DUF2752 domain-containing protein [Planctomycetota bacterium]
MNGTCQYERMPGAKESDPILPAELQSTGATGGLYRRCKSRIVAALVAVPCLAIVALAASLHADGRGYDTHTQLGLSPCSMIQTTGMPCPTCGMTTAFANMAHGRFLSALKANVFGVVLFLVAVLYASSGVVQAVTGRNILAGRFLRPRTWW